MLLIEHIRKLTACNEKQYASPATQFQYIEPLAAVRDSTTSIEPIIKYPQFSHSAARNSSKVLNDEADGSAQVRVIYILPVCCCIRSLFNELATSSFQWLKSDRCSRLIFYCSTWSLGQIPAKLLLRLSLIKCSKRETKRTVLTQLNS